MAEKLEQNFPSNLLLMVLLPLAEEGTKSKEGMDFAKLK